MQVLKQQVAIIRYNAGNIRSVMFAMERLGVRALVTDDEATIRAASHVIFPGVGAANSAMPYLRERGLDTLIKSLEQPFLGICLGMQLMCGHSEEGNETCLGIFNINVRRFLQPPLGQPVLKIPHMGWNALHQVQSPLMTGMAPGEYTYFVHSFFAELAPETIATTYYGVPFSAALHKNNFYGVQFHVEKSATVGERILKNFLGLSA